MSSNSPTITPNSTLLSRRISSLQEPSAIFHVRGDVSSSAEKTMNAPQYRITVRGFQPLPSITASPICTPTPSTINEVEPSETDVKNTGLISAVTDIPASSLSDSSRVSLPSGTPTWIATPPTPPPKPIRRSNSTRLTRQRSFTQFIAYTSPPASMQQPHAVTTTAMKAVKRSSSVPTFPTTRLSSNHAIFLSFMDAQFVQSPRPISPCPQNPFESSFSVLYGDAGPMVASRNKRAGTFSQPSAHDELESSKVFDNSDSQCQDDPSLDGSCSDHSTESSWEAENHKDTLRRFHALKELLSTEVGYLKDLRFFVTVYLRNLPTLVVRSMNATSAFGRASASFATAPWTYTTAQLQTTASTTSPASGDVQNVANPSPISTKPSRYVFGDHEVELLTRNAEDILRLHEHFVRELRLLLEPLGYAMDDDELHHGYQHLSNLDSAIRIVSTKFATEASRFNAYQTFCAGHPEAMDALRKAYQQSPVELDTFEQRCSTIISDTLENRTQHANSEPPLRPSRSSTDGPSTGTQNLTVNAENRKRATSLTSLDNAVRTLRTRSSINIPKDSIAFPTESTAKRDLRPTLSHRIAFSDYLIKPIQRICKYPLLLDQLLPSKTLRSLSLQNRGSSKPRPRAEVVVESAAQAMRHVATSVDEARRQQDIAVQSGLIFTRICAGLQVPSASALASGQAITSEFLSSLGTCVLSGSLDVMHYSPERPLGFASSIKAKYLGAFLYAGGYIIFVKVSKGKKYEPRHWFSLVDFDITDVQDDSAMLPCSILLSSGEHQFEIAAACQREKDAWLSCIRQALKTIPTWGMEPTPSFLFDDKGGLLPPPSDDGHSEAHSLLPTIRSIPEISHTSDTETSEPFFASLRGNTTRKKRRRYDSTVSMSAFNPKQQMDAQPPCRRSSTASVKNIFGPITTPSDSETIVITRSSPIARIQVDQELQDVISQSCLTARSYASSHETELFQAPTKAGRRNSTISMARLSKHENVRVPRRRTTDSTEGSVSQNNSPSKNIPAPSTKNVKKLSLNSIPFNKCDITTASHETSLSPYPSPPSSHSSCSRASTLGTPIDNDPSAAQLTPAFASLDHHTKQPRSFVRNVKGLFNLRPVSPVSPISVIVIEHDHHTIRSPTSPSRHRSRGGDPQEQPNGGLLNRWRKGSIRYRSKSRQRESGRPPSIFEDELPEKPYPIVPLLRSAAPLLT